MAGFLILIFTIFTLYILSRFFIQKLFLLLLRITRSREKSATILGIIFLPGTFIHEISHFLTALFLLVPVGKINLMPEIRENGVKLGSVEIAKTDFLRGSVIGLSPLIIGLSIILFLTSYFILNNSQINVWLILIFVFIIFQITNTMFSSKSDLRAVLELSVFVLFVVVFLLVFKINTPFLFLYEKIVVYASFFEKFSLFLLIPVTLEGLIILALRKVV